MDWYFFAILALGFYAIQGLLFKYSASKKSDENWTTFYYLLTVTIISVPVVLISGISLITTIGLIAAITDGIFYAITTITR